MFFAFFLELFLISCYNKGRRGIFTILEFPPILEIISFTVPRLDGKIKANYYWIFLTLKTILFLTQWWYDVTLVMMLHIIKLNCNNSTIQSVNLVVSKVVCMYWDSYLSLLANWQAILVLHVLFWPLWIILSSLPTLFDVLHGAQKIKKIVLW